MKIVVLNGSPKGEKSVTLQYVRFMELAEPDHRFTIHHVGKISKIEKNEEEWSRICLDLKDADIILWATPVYFQHVPSQMKRFIELIFERDSVGLFSGKYAASLTTSVHFFDQKVHEYLQGISEDLGMNWAGSFSAAMNDILKEECQRNLCIFTDDLLASCGEKRPSIRAYPPLPSHTRSYSPGQAGIVNTHGKRVLILHDADKGSTLEAMVRQMASSFSEVRVFPLNEIGMNGGCLGCTQCAFENQCIYSDEFCTFWKEDVAPADIIVAAGTIKDRYLSANWKQFFDRSFFLGHIPRYSAKQIIIMIQGPLAEIPGLRENLVSLFSTGNVVDIITDEPKDSGIIDTLIRSVAERAVHFSCSGFSKPPLFPEVAGHIVLRDAIWRDLRPFFRADHRYYKSHGLYDFPQYQYRKRISTAFFSFLMSIPQIRRKVKPVMATQMIQPLIRAVQESHVLSTRKNQEDCSVLK